MPTFGKVSRISTERESQFGENNTSLSVYAMISPGAPESITFHAPPLPMFFSESIKYWIRPSSFSLTRNSRTSGQEPVSKTIKSNDRPASFRPDSIHTLKTSTDSAENPH